MLEGDEFELTKPFDAADGPKVMFMATLLVSLERLVILSMAMETSSAVTSDWRATRAVAWVARAAVAMVKMLKCILLTKLVFKIWIFLMVRLLVLVVW